MKVFEGKVISTGMTNTIVVEIFRVTPHPLYRKLIRSSKKYKVDTNGFEEIAVGNNVEITETKPISKGKYFKVTKIVGAVLRDAQDASSDARKQDKKVEKAEVKKEEKTEVKSTAKVEAKAKSKKTTKKKEVKS